MRVSASVLRRLSPGIFALIILLLAVIPAYADTGTYRISDYVVNLEPQNDGQVRITVAQQWQVLSGDIPWVTVGLPNKYFSIENSGGAASKVSAENGSGFTGVRIDLDKDYKTGQSFSVKFSVLQNNLLERLTSDNKWRINYTPGWYDRASIDHLQINLVSPVDYTTYSSVSPMPSSVNGNVITWERLNLSPGNRFSTTEESTDGSFLTASPPSTSKSVWSDKSFYITIAIILAVGFLIFWAIHKNRQNRDARAKERVYNIEAEMAANKQKKEEIEKGFNKYVEDKNIQPDAQGKYYDRSYGDYITPAIWAGVISHQFYQQPPYQPRSNVRQGCVSSCACVSCACACACACAGGGAAGCSRKSLHECRTCATLKGKTPGINAGGTAFSKL
jgi:hypothetical protein